MDKKTRDEASAAGYAAFNRGPHFCVDIPDGHSTVTCRTSTGELLTFAFVPYEEGGAPKCVDVHHKTARRTFVQDEVFGPGREVNRPAGPDEAQAMNVICFSGGQDAYRSRSFSGYGKPTTLVGILLE